MLYRRLQPFPEAFGVVVGLKLAGGLAEPGGRLLAMKGADPEDEKAALPAGFRVLAVHPLEVPGLDAERCLVELEKQA